VGAGTKCYAVDTWQGDPQSGFFGAEVLGHLRAHHDPLYGEFSRLVQGRFDEAAAHFDDGSVDLLHVDGFHTYEEVSRDFETWLPKMSGRGVVVLHDTNARRPEYGVWRLWEEIKQRYRHFELVHAHGLGVLAVGPERPRGFDELLSASDDEARWARELFFQLGHRLRVLLLLEDRRQKALELGQRLASVKSVLEERTRTTEEVVGRLREQVGETQARLHEVQMRLDEERRLRAEAERRLDGASVLLTHPARVVLRRLRDRARAVGRPRVGAAEDGATDSSGVTWRAGSTRD
jgi:hypothetical protein